MTSSPSTRTDRGAVDGGLEVLFGAIAVICFVLLIVETSAFWHARNIFGEAAAEGVRVAAAFDGSCAAGESTAATLIARRARNWARDITVTCTINGDVATLHISGHSPGVLFGATGIDIAVTESAPVER